MYICINTINTYVYIYIYTYRERDTHTHIYQTLETEPSVLFSSARSGTMRPSIAWHAATRSLSVNK